MVDDVRVSGDGAVIDMATIRDEVDKWLLGIGSGDDRAPARERAPTVETWGTSPEAQRGQDAMMRLLG